MSATPAPLTRKQALDLLGTVVAERPDHVYEEPNDEGLCLYTYRGAPSCVVGHVLARHGWPIAALRELDTFSTPAGALPGEFADNEAAIVLDLAQVAQDEGQTWLEALEAASGQSREDESDDEPEYLPPDPAWQAEADFESCEACQAGEDCPQHPF